MTTSSNSHYRVSFLLPWVEPFCNEISMQLCFPSCSVSRPQESPTILSLHRTWCHSFVAFLMTARWTVLVHFSMVKSLVFLSFTFFCELGTSCLPPVILQCFSVPWEWLWEPWLCLLPPPGENVSFWDSLFHYDRAL